MNAPQLLAKVSRRLIRDTWLLAYRFGPSPFTRLALGHATRSVLSGLRVLQPPRGYLWADPFPVQVNGRHYIVFEEYRHSVGRGTLACIHVGPRGIIGGPWEILSGNSHLSYPFLVRDEDKLYLVPETAEAGSVTLYSCDSLPHPVVERTTLIEGVDAADCTIVKHEGRWWMFFANGSQQRFVRDQLHIYHAPAICGPWAPHPANPVKTCLASSRPAGAFVRIGTRLLRPSQDGSTRYGGAIVLNEVLQLDMNGYRERAVAKVLPTWKWGLKGTHTINHDSGLTVLDGLSRRLRLFDR